MSAARASAMLLLLVAVAACFTSTQAAGRSWWQQTPSGPLSWQPPAWCRGHDCPEFAVIQTAKDGELRAYKPAHWITTNVTNETWSDAYNKGYKKLMDYVGGHNKNQTTLDQTAPTFSLFYTVGTGDQTVENRFTFEYFVPFELQDVPPEPMAEDVNIVRVPEQDVWVQVFGGFATQDDIITRGFEFMKFLQDQGFDVHTEWIGCALYESPTRLLDRHNEIWIFSKTRPTLDLDMDPDTISGSSASSLLDRMAAATDDLMEMAEQEMSRLAAIFNVPQPEPQQQQQHASQAVSEAVSEKGDEAQWDPPSWCRGRDCPQFSVLQTMGEDVELRQYEPAHWISTNITNKKWSDAFSKGYKRLTDYMKGHNEQGRKLPYTSPLFTLMYPSSPEGGSRAVDSYFTIEYFVPFELQESPPEPSADEVGVVQVPSQQVWVQSFGGYATESDILERGFNLMDTLRDQGHDVSTEWLGFAQYDDPMRLINRHNEVWIFAKEEDPSGGQIRNRDWQAVTVE